MIEALWQYTKEIIAWAAATMPAQLAFLIAMVVCAFIIWRAYEHDN